MADVIDSTQAAEPSMEEILASIRKIIADDGVPAPAGTAESDVIELTQMVQDDGTVVDVNASEPEQPLPSPVMPEVSPPPPTPGRASYAATSATPQT
jgi:cell pole-organizing protein PopZ